MVRNNIKISQNTKKGQFSIKKDIIKYGEKKIREVRLTDTFRLPSVRKKFSR